MNVHHDTTLLHKTLITLIALVAQD